MKIRSIINLTDGITFIWTLFLLFRLLSLEIEAMDYTPGAEESLLLLVFIPFFLGFEGEFFLAASLLFGPIWALFLYETLRKKVQGILVIMTLGFLANYYLGVFSIWVTLFAVFTPLFTLIIFGGIVISNSIEDLSRRFPLKVV